jgi:hypothetical protein
MDEIETSAYEFMNSNKKSIEPRTAKSSKLIEVIETISYRGNGVDTVFREIIQYWSKEGVLLAENDPYSRDKVEARRLKPGPERK